MVSTRNKKQSNRRLLSQLDGFDQDVIIGNAADSVQQYVVFVDGTVDRWFTVNNSGSISTTNENAVNVQTLERCFNEKIDSEMGNFVDAVGERIQKAIMIAIDNTITPRVELAVRSINALLDGLPLMPREFGAWGTYKDGCLFRERIRK